MSFYMKKVTISSPLGGSVVLARATSVPGGCLLSVNLKGTTSVLYNTDVTVSWYEPNIGPVLSAAAAVVTLLAARDRFEKLETPDQELVRRLEAPASFPGLMNFQPTEAELIRLGELSEKFGWETSNG